MPGFQFGRGERWAIVSAFAYAAIGVMLRAAAPTIDPVLGSLLRQVPMVVIAVAALAIVGWRDLRPGSPEFLGWPFIAALAVSGALSGSFTLLRKPVSGMELTDRAAALLEGSGI